MNKSKLWIGLALVLVFAAGVTLGVFGGRWLLVQRPPDRRANPPSQDRWAKELGLTSEQQAQIKDVFKKYDEPVKGLRTDFNKHLGEIRDAMRKDIDAVLTPEQRQKQAAMIQKMEQRRRDNPTRDKQGESPVKDNPTKEKQGEKEADHRGSGPGSSRGGWPGAWPF